jgi:hypothetical protein
LKGTSHEDSIEAATIVGVPILHERSIHQARSNKITTNDGVMSLYEYQGKKRGTDER